jgi:hypothetical protein
MYSTYLLSDIAKLHLSLNELFSFCTLWVAQPAAWFVQPAVWIAQLTECVAHPAAWIAHPAAWVAQMTIWVFSGKVIQNQCC